MNTTENELESTADNSANLIALASIMSGLLASGHYTVSADQRGEGLPALVADDLGKEWKSFREEMPYLDGRHWPVVIDHADRLLKHAIRISNDPL